jgi:hypothetical protein
MGEIGKMEEIGEIREIATNFGRGGPRQKQNIHLLYK